MLDRLQELGGAGHLPLPLQELAHPGHLLLEVDVPGLAFLVAPVGRYAVLGEVVEVVGLDLHFQWGAALAYDRCVEGLVHVLLGVGDVVVELAWDGVPKLVDDAQGLVAVLLGVDDNTEGVEVVYLAQFLALGRVAFHLLVGAVDALGPSYHLTIEVELMHLFAEAVGHHLDVLLPLNPLGGEHSGDLPGSGSRSGGGRRGRRDAT